MAASAISTGGMVFWAFLIGIIAVMGGVAVFRLRKHLLGGESTTQGTGWTLQDLEQMRQSGQITEQEFKALRRRILEAWTEPASPARSDELTSLPEPNDNTRA